MTHPAICFALGKSSSPGGEEHEQRERRNSNERQRRRVREREGEKRSANGRAYISSNISAFLFCASLLEHKT